MEFTIEQIKDVINILIEELSPNFTTVFDISFFLGKVANKLMTTFENEETTFETKLNVITGIADNVVNELEERGLITFELSHQFKEIFKDSSEYKKMLLNINNFFSLPAEKKQEIIVSSIQNLLTNFLT